MVNYEASSLLRRLVLPDDTHKSSTWEKESRALCRRFGFQKTRRSIFRQPASHSLRSRHSLVSKEWTETRECALPVRIGPMVFMGPKSTFFHQNLLTPLVPG